MPQQLAKTADESKGLVKLTKQASHDSDSDPDEVAKQIADVEANKSGYNSDRAAEEYQEAESPVPTPGLGKTGGGGLAKKRKTGACLLDSDSLSDEDSVGLKEGSRSDEISAVNEAMDPEAKAFIASYINASHVNGLVEDFSRRSMIACMAPNDASLARFWIMIWQQKVNLIVMLCPDGANEKNGKSREESIAYWKGIRSF